MLSKIQCSSLPLKGERIIIHYTLQSHGGPDVHTSMFTSVYNKKGRTEKENEDLQLCCIKNQTAMPANYFKT